LENYKNGEGMMCVWYAINECAEGVGGSVGTI